MTDDTKRVSELPKDWRPGDSGFVIDDSSPEPPTIEELKAFRQSIDSGKAKEP
ncbi:MAG: hypothetical protein H0X04_00525 [Chthoniobacterales bacterium]|nr:hypothetical protein [Chthoniobacterales bacterium]